MTWRPDDPPGHEQDKIAAFVVPYTRGRGLDVGCGRRKCWPHMIGVDDGTDRRLGHTPDAEIYASGDDLGLFASDSLDFVFSSHLLEHLLDTRAALAEWWRVIKPGGHLCLYLPHADLYPRIGQPGANRDHKHDFLPEDIRGHMLDVAADSGYPWTLVEDEVRGEGVEYSFYQVFRKGEHVASPLDDPRADCIETVWGRRPGGKPRALVVRFGAIGDQIMAASVLPLLKEQGYHVTYMTTPEAQQVLLHNPSVDDWLIQDKDQVPNPQLGAYFETIAPRYDKIVNLCESIEGSLLVLPGRPSHSWLPEARRKILGTVNYLERTHDLAGVPHRFAPRFHPTDAERRRALTYKSTLGGPVVMWAIGGSSVHKIYPFTNVVIDWLLKRTDAHVLLSAGGDMAALEDGLVEMLGENGADLSRLHRMDGDWDIRRSLTFAEYADVVVGPETGILNAASHLDVPKIVMLSHSSRENLTKHWKKTIVLEPERGTTPCSPCHRLHYAWDHCPRVEATGGALCASNIRPETVFQAVRRALDMGRRGRGKVLAEAAD